ncbi:MAG: metalloprotease TldD [Pelagibacteraceae bacterium]|nr:metalloprotease TldD [Pelagibacteraceae bacterium]OUV89404.1 MAG: metalloprotease TldD [Pelagibacteraceae bacterium TMED146]|tara:strand:+ start:3767 stop:5185 length:1419 start_codon:yes stop_codon:yes gene_type:complete
MSDFFNNSDISQQQAEQVVSETLNNCDDGELFLENSKSESLVLDDGKIKNTSFDSSLGFGFRTVQDDKTAFCHSNIISKKSLNDASQNLVSNMNNGSNKVQKQSNPKRTNVKLYEDKDPIENKPFKEKVELLKKIDNYVRQKNLNIKQVTASFFGEHQSVEIIKSDNQVYKDQRPLVRFNVSVMMERNGKKETGSYGTGGRMDYENYLGSDNWKTVCDEAIRQAEVNLNSKPAPAGEMKVVLGPGWPGIILHEAIGHGLEGDFNRKKTSAFHNLVGQKIAHENVTVVDDGTIASRRGSLTIDDEGTPTSRNVLIENGILKNFMQDRMNAKLMKVEPTGNGRRESFEYAPMPRMTNTFMINGNHTQDEMIKSVDKGIYAVSFGGGQVDITNGKFVFSCTEAYEIINGKIGAPLKGVTLIGNGPDILTKVSMVGNDMKLDPGIGTCGKAGQWVPVGVGQPSILVDQITVGGTSI